MKKLFGNGRPLAIALFAIGVVAAAVPAFGASSGGNTSGGSSSSSAAPSLHPPPAMVLSGKSRKQVEQTAQCMKDHGIAPPPDPSLDQGSTPPKPPSSSEFGAAAKACGLPKPPGGAMPQLPMGAPGAPPMGAPGGLGKLDPSAVQRCLHAQAQKH
jgi:hypothetical protein